jgi:hypothetical protein
MTFTKSITDFGKNHNAFEAFRENMPTKAVQGSMGGKYSPIDDPSRSKNNLLAQRAALNLPWVTESTGGISSKKLMCQDDEVMDDYDLLYNIYSARPSVINQPLTQISRLLPSPPDSQEDAIEEVSMNANKPVSLDLSWAHRMTDLALRNLIGGPQIKSQPGIKIRKPHPRQTLSRIAPSLFNPGFLEVSLASHAFLQGIEHR